MLHPSISNIASLWCTQSMLCKISWCQRNICSLCFQLCGLKVKINHCTIDSNWFYSCVYFPLLLPMLQYFLLSLNMMNNFLWLRHKTFHDTITFLKNQFSWTDVLQIINFSNNCYTKLTRFKPNNLIGYSDSNRAYFFFPSFIL